MARGDRAFVKVEGDFILGRNRAGEKFFAMKPQHQLLFLRLWAYARDRRQDAWETGPKTHPITRQITHRIIGRIIGTNPGRLPALFKAYEAAGFLQVSECGRFHYLKGFREIHNKLKMKPSPYGEDLGTEQGEDGGSSGIERGETESQSESKETKETDRGKVIPMPREASEEALRFFGIPGLQEIFKKCKWAEAVELDKAVRSVRIAAGKRLQAQGGAGAAGAGEAPPAAPGCSVEAFVACLVEKHALGAEHPGAMAIAAFGRGWRPSDQSWLRLKQLRLEGAGLARREEAPAGGEGEERKFFKLPEDKLTLARAIYRENRLVCERHGINSPEELLTSQLFLGLVRESSFDFSEAGARVEQPRHAELQA